MLASRAEFPFGCVQADEDRVTKLVEKPCLEQTVNTGMYVINPELIHEASSLFGAQCVVLSIDYKVTADKGYEVYTHCGGQATGLS